MEIRVELEDVSSVKKKLRVEVPAEAALARFNDIADDYRKRVRLSGFRRGKSPVGLVKRRFSKEIRNDLVNKLVPESYRQALREKALEPLGEPDLKELSFETGQPLKYVAELEIRPRVVLPDFKGLEVSSDVQPVTAEEMEQALEGVREENARLVAVEDRPAEEGDHVIIDLVGEYLGETSSRSRQPIRDEGVVVKVGEEKTHKAFTQALIGANIGEHKQFEVEYGADYGDKKLAGNVVRFTVEVTDIKRPLLPQLNDEFAKDLGEFDTLDQVRDKIRGDLERSRERNRENDLKNRLMDQVIQSTPFEVPETLVEKQIDSKVREVAVNLASQGRDPSKADLDWKQFRSDLRPSCAKEVRAMLILNELADREEIQVGSTDLDQELERIAASWHQPKEGVRRHFQAEGRMEELRKQIRRGKALDLLLRQAKVVER